MRKGLFVLVLSFAIGGNWLYWQLGPDVGFPILLFAVGLAFAGEGNRLLWACVFPLVCGLLAGAVYGLYAWLPPEPAMLRPMLAFVLVSVVPALILWSAVMLKAFRRDARVAAQRATT